jgi:hypothetical protein
MASLNKVSMQYYGVKLSPGAMVSDHRAAFRNAFYTYFPNGVFGTCYPHIKRKYGEGEYTSEKGAHFGEAGEDINPSSQKRNSARSARQISSSGANHTGYMLLTCASNPLGWKKNG